MTSVQALGKIDWPIMTDTKPNTQQEDQLYTSGYTWGPSTWCVRGLSIKLVILAVGIFIAAWFAAPYWGSVHLGPWMIAVSLLNIVCALGVILHRYSIIILAALLCLFQACCGFALVVGGWVTYGTLMQSGGYWVVTQPLPYHFSFIAALLLVALSIRCLAGLRLPEVRELCLMQSRWQLMDRGLCPLCSYDMRGSEAGICSECGTHVEKVGRTYRVDLAEQGVVLDKKLFRVGVVLLTVLSTAYGTHLGMERSRDYVTSLGADMELIINEVTAGPGGSWHYYITPELPAPVRHSRGGGGGEFSTSDSVDQYFSQHEIVEFQQIDYASVRSKHLQLYNIKFTTQREPDPHQGEKSYDVDLDLAMRAEVHFNKPNVSKITNEDTGKELVSPFILEPGEHRLKFIELIGLDEE